MEWTTFGVATLEYPSGNTIEVSTAQAILLLHLERCDGAVTISVMGNTHRLVLTRITQELAQASGLSRAHIEHVLVTLTCDDQQVCTSMFMSNSTCEQLVVGSVGPEFSGSDTFAFNANFMPQPNDRVHAVHLGPKSEAVRRYFAPTAVDCNML